jgi:hypothetical protein
MTSDEPTTASLAEVLDRLARLEALMLPSAAGHWIGVTATARRLGVDRTTIHRWAVTGQLGPHAREWRNRWSFDPEWVAEQATKRNTPRKDTK